MRSRNAKALPLHAGIAKGIFERRGFKIELELTERLAASATGCRRQVRVVHSAVDNALAMIEVGKHDVVIVSGGDSGMNEFFVQGEIKSFADCAGDVSWSTRPTPPMHCRSKKILAQHGLKDGDYKVKPVGAGVYRFKAMVEDKTTPRHSQSAVHRAGRAAGMKSLGRTIDLLGPYQAAGAFAMRGWAEKNRAGAGALLAAYVEALRWIRDPANRAENIALLMDKLKISARTRGAHLRAAARSRLRLHPDARFDMAKASERCWRCAPRSRGEQAPPPPRAMSISAITSGR